MKKRSLALGIVLLLALSLCLPLAGAEEAPLKTYTAMVSVNATQGDLNEMWLVEEIRTLFNVEIIFDQVSTEGFNEKKNLAFATDSLPDLFFDMTSTEIANYGGQGLLLPLEDYMTEEYLPNLMYWFERYPEYERALYYPDGHVYDIQGLIILEREYATVRSWINEAWCEQLGIAVPKTVDEFYDYLVMVKNTDLNGNGEHDEIPFEGIFKEFDNYYDNTLPVLFAFGMTTKTVEAADDGVVRFNPATEPYKEYLTYMNRLWTEGLIDPEYFTQTTDQWKAKISQGLAASYTDYAQWLRMSDPAEWRKYSAYDPMTSDINDKQMWAATDVNLSRHFIITSACEDPEGIMPVLNWALTPDAIYDPVKGDNNAGATVNVLGKPIGAWDKYTEYGWQIVEKTDAAGATYTAIESIYPEDEFASMNAFRSAVLTPTVFPVCEVFEGNPAHYSHYGTETELALAEEIIEHNAPYYHVGWSPNIRYTEAEAEELSLITADLLPYAGQMVAKFIIGDEPIDQFDSFVEGCRSRGLDRYVEINQTAYDRYMAN